MENRPSHSQILEIDGVRLLKVRRRITKGKRPLWSDQEIRELIDIIKEKKMLPALTRRKYGRNEMFKVICENLKKRGFVRTPEQINTKWKQLRLSYHRAKAEHSRTGLETDTEDCPFYEELDELHTGKTRPKPPQPIQPGTFIQIDPAHLFKIDPANLIKLDASNCILVQSPVVPVQKKEEPKERIYSNAIENKAWLTKVLQTTEKEWADSRTEKDRELTEHRHWEEKLVEKQSAALTKANNEFLRGLRGIVEFFKK